MQQRRAVLFDLDGMYADGRGNVPDSASRAVTAGRGRGLTMRRAMIMSTCSLVGVLGVGTADPASAQDVCVAAAGDVRHQDGTPTCQADGRGSVAVVIGGESTALAIGGDGNVAIVIGAHSYGIAAVGDGNTAIVVGDGSGAVAAQGDDNTARVIGDNDTAHAVEGDGNTAVILGDGSCAWAAGGGVTVVVMGDGIRDCPE